MLAALARLLSAIARLTLIVVISVVAGLTVAFVSRNIHGDVLEVLALYATFAVPLIVAWLLLRAMYPSRSRAADPPDVGVLDNANAANNDKRQGPAERCLLR